MRNGDKGEVADDLRQVFRTGDRNYTVEKAWEEWQSFCSKWGRYYRSIKRRCDDPSYKAYFTYLNYDHRKTAMDKKSYLRQVPRIDLDKTLFPD